MRPANGDFEKFLDEVVALGDEADDCVCPACLAGMIYDLMEAQRLLQSDVGRILKTLDMIVRKLDEK